MSEARGPRLLPLLLLLGCSGTHATEVYRWVDPEGVTHLSQTPPPSGSYQTLSLPSASAPDPDAESRVQQAVEQLEAGQRERSRRQAQERATLQRQSERERRCQAASQNLATLDNLGARGLRLPDGSIQRPTPEELARLRDQARTEQAQSCD